jgi:hypothetical protein
VTPGAGATRTKPKKKKQSRATGADIPVRAFKDAAAWESWLAKNSDRQ